MCGTSFPVLLHRSARICRRSSGVPTLPTAPPVELADWPLVVCLAELAVFTPSCLDRRAAPRRVWETISPSHTTHRRREEQMGYDVY